MLFLVFTGKVPGKQTAQYGWDTRSGVIIMSQVGFSHVSLTFFFSLDRLMGSTERVLSAFSFFLSLFD